MLKSAWMRRVWLALAVLRCAVTPAYAEGIRDWPCEGPLVDPLLPEAVWGGALPAPLPTDWRSDARAAEVVALAANPENRPSTGAQAIEQLAGGLDGDRQEVLLAVFAGLLEQFNLQRGFVIGGVRDFVVRAKILQEAIDKNTTALAALTENGGAGVEEQRKGYREARAFDARTQDDALEEAEFLCRRYAYLEEKLRDLTRAIRAAL